jgi:predicted nucleotidyltransferase component of viral defense system
MAMTIADFHDLTEPQRRLLTRLEQDTSFCETFYFTGGTLLKALGIVPRESNDLDFFTFPTVDEHTYTTSLVSVRRMLEERFENDTIVDTQRGFLLSKERMVVECIYDTVANIDAFAPYGRLNVTGLRDLLANKAAAFCVRDEVKDLIDIAFLTKQHGWLLSDIADIAERRFHLQTISEEKLLTELIHKRDMFAVTPDMFLRNGTENARLVEEQIEHLLQSSNV